MAFPRARAVAGSVSAPSSKSATNRALLLAAFSDTAVELHRPLECEDAEAMQRCLAAMGACLSPSESGLLVCGPLRGSGKEEIPLDVGDSGTAARFLTAAAAVTEGRFLLTGSPRLCERPVGELVEALRAAGALLQYRGLEGCLPLSVRGRPMRAGRVEVDASRSSQFLSALLLAGAAGEGDLEVRASGRIASAPYVQLTIEALREFGHEVFATGGSLRVRRGRTPPARYETPRDYSSALPLLAVPGIVGGEVTVQGLGFPSSDPGALALPVLERMGLRIEAGRSRVTSFGSPEKLSPASVEAADFPDAVPTLAVLAAFASGQSRLTGIPHLRWKESDRIAALAAVLTQAGAQALAGEEELVVEGPPRSRDGGLKRLPTFRDHRIAMAAALLSLALPGSLIEDPDSVAKSYPNFFRDLEQLVVR